MKNSPVSKALLVYLLYPALVLSWALVVGADYNNLVSRDVIVVSLVLPMALGTVLMAGAISWLGWWRPVMTEDRRDSPRWVKWPIIVLMLAFIGINAMTTDWSAIGAGHLAMMLGVALLVGFNEESLCRGVLVTAFRKAAYSEKKVWFLSSLMFGMMHLTNGFLGIGFSSALTQAFMTFLAATAYYILRRASGTLLVPILFHAGWDFSLFAQQASGAPAAMFPEVVLDFLIGFLALGLVFLVIRTKPAENRSTA